MKNASRHTQLNESKWDEFAKSMDDTTWTKDYLRQAQTHLVSLIQVQEGMHVLDIGCGTGRALGQIAMRVNGRDEFYGVDLSAGMLDRAREHFKGADNFHFIKANSESIPLDNDFFDVIICTNSFHHYLDPVQALKEMRRLVNVGGKIFILDPTADLWVTKLADQVIKFFEAEHVKLYSTKEFQELFANAGLTYVDTKTISWHQKVHVGAKQT